MVCRTTDTSRRWQRLVLWVPRGSAAEASRLARRLTTMRRIDQR
jgi:hypothetical protein